MKRQLSTSKHGFTIIEVVLVLAIAGLIFLMVFVALPALQRSQRDTQRRDDMSRVSSALTNYIANNNSMPDASSSSTASSAAAKFLTEYLKGNTDATKKSEFMDPDGVGYSINIAKRTSTNTGATNGTTAHQVNIITNAKCNGETTEASSGANNFAVLYKLEGSGTVCVDNQ